VTRIWHQSITDLTRQVNYAATLEKQARTICHPSTVIDLHGVRPDTYPKGVSAGQVSMFPWAHHMIDIQIIENARRAEAEGYDAVAIACFHDPGLQEARSAVDIPVLGMAESALLAAAPFGTRYGLICLHDPVIPFLRRLVDGYGYRDRVVTVQALDPPVTGLELETVYEDSSLLHTRVRELAESCAKAGAEVLIPAEGILNTLFVHHDIAELGGIPIMDSFGALLAHTEMTVALRERRNMQVSRRGTYLRPSAGVVDQMRRATGAALVDEWR
jgi:allantoin racemase